MSATATDTNQNTTQEVRITKKNAAIQLGVCLSTVDRLIVSGHLRVLHFPIRVQAIVLQESVNELLTRMRGEQPASA